MTEIEQQLRLIIREHAADSEHLLDEALAEADATGRSYGAHVFEEHAKTLQRSLSALREAVQRRLYSCGDWDDKAKRYRQKKTHLATCGCGDCEIIKAYYASHDAAPSPPTLTLEEVEEETLKYVRGTASGTYLADGALWLAERLKERLAQKGAGRG
jgi:hypothetical protein